MGALAPFLILVATAAVIAVRGPGRASGTRGSAGIAWLGVFACTLACLRVWGHRIRALLWLDADAFSLFLSLVVLTVLLLAIPVAKESLARQKREGPGFYVLLLLSAAGMLLLVSSRHLAVVFVGLEAMSIGVYALAGWSRDRPASIEASLKYFFYGTTASAFFLYGIALFYVVAGSADLAKIESALMAISTRGDDPALLPVAALGLLLVGLVYTMAAVPFHMWAPDVYEGAPAMVGAFMAVAVKTAALGALLRITGMLFSLTDEWKAVLSILAVVAMTVGNLLALAQDDFKRLLAYSGIAHAGYLLVGVVAGGVAGRSAVLFYLLGYSFMTVGAFAVAVALGKRGEASLSVREWGGLGWKYPLPGVAMSLFMLSLAGIPMTVGFVGKFYVLSAAISEGYVALVLVAVMNALVGAYYALRVITVLYMAAPVPDPELGTLGWRMRVPLLLASLATIALGVLPSSVMELARRAALELF
jgi:NADH-quinone oxidoreductase subunit N